MQWTGGGKGDNMSTMQRDALKPPIKSSMSSAAGAAPSQAASASVPPAAVDSPIPAPAAAPLPCEVVSWKDGSADVTIHIEPEIVRRIKTRAQSQDLAEYIWQNILKRAIETHVY